MSTRQHLRNRRVMRSKTSGWFAPMPLDARQELTRMKLKQKLSADNEPKQSEAEDLENKQ